MALREASRYFGQQQLTSLASSVGLTVPTAQVTGETSYRPAFALLQAEGQSIRWRDDNTAPTASVGMILNVGADPYPYDGDLSRIRFIETAASAKLNVSYYA